MLSISVANKHAIIMLLLTHLQDFSAAFIAHCSMFGGYLSMVTRKG